MSDYRALKAELANDPAALGYAGKTDAQVAALLNAATAPVATRARIADLQAYVFREGLYAALEDAAKGYTDADLNKQAAVRRAARETVSLWTARFDAVDTTAPAFGRALEALRSGGVITAAQQAAVVELGRRPGPSRAESTFGAAVTEHDVARARSLP